MEWSDNPDIVPRSPSPLGRKPSGADFGRKRRNSHQSAVFGEAGNGAVVRISELSLVDKKDAGVIGLDSMGPPRKRPSAFVRRGGAAE